MYSKRKHCGGQYVFQTFTWKQKVNKGTLYCKYTGAWLFAVWKVCVTSSFNWFPVVSFRLFLVSVFATLSFVVGYTFKPIMHFLLSTTTQIDIAIYIWLCLITFVQLSLRIIQLTTHSVYKKPQLLDNNNFKQTCFGNCNSTQEMLYIQRARCLCTYLVHCTINQTPSIVIYLRTILEALDIRRDWYGVRRVTSTHLSTTDKAEWSKDNETSWEKTKQEQRSTV